LSGRKKKPRGKEKEGVLIPGLFLKSRRLGRKLAGVGKRLFGS